MPIRSGGGGALTQPTAPAIADQEFMPPGAPTGLAAAVGDTQSVVTWTANTEGDLASYTLERSLASGSGFAEVATITAGTETYTNTGLTNGTTYYYRLLATDTLGNASGYSSEASVVPVTAVTDSDWCLYSDGSYEYMTISDSSGDLDFQIGDTMSVAFWLKTNNGGWGGKGIVTTRSSSGSQPGWAIEGVSSGGTTEFCLDSGADRANWKALSDVEDQTWHHIVWTWDGTSPNESDLGTSGALCCYVDGVLEEPVLSSTYGGDVGVIDYATADPRLFARDDTGYGIKGWLDDVRIYGVVLSAVEAAAIYNDGDGQFGTAGVGTEAATGGITQYDELLGWWKMEEGTGDVVADASGNGLEGTRVNADWHDGTPSA